MPTLAARPLPQASAAALRPLLLQTAAAVSPPSSAQPFSSDLQCSMAFLDAGLSPPSSPGALQASLQAATASLASLLAPLPGLATALNTSQVPSALAHHMPPRGVP